MSKTTNLEFRKIPSLDFLYEITADGRYIRNVKSKAYTNSRLDFHHSSKGYYAAFFNINNKENGGRKVVRRMVHRMVAECWLGPCPEGKQVDHINRNPHNNHHSNLRYVTHSEQMKNRELGQHVIEQAKANCQKWVKECKSVPVTIEKDGEIINCNSLTEASRIIGSETNSDVEYIRAKFKQRRSHIKGYEVIYRNAETERQ